MRLTFEFILRPLLPSKQEAATKVAGNVGQALANVLQFFYSALPLLKPHFMCKATGR